MEGYFSTGQGPQWAVVPIEEEEEEKKKKKNHHQAKYKNTVLVHSASAHTMVCALAECTSFDIWPDDGSVNRNMAPDFKYFITNICCVIDWGNYCIIAKHNGVASFKVQHTFTHKQYTEQHN